ncbi:MAG: pyridoxal phosphate-dependent aminotransferase [bacterium]|nr:pyridoxal phosphate-dependent aminotransferase [bacterium]
MAVKFPTTRFGRNDYLSWYRPRLWREGDAAIDLHSSGVAWVEPHELTLPAEDSEGMVSRFESGLADWLGLTPQEVVFTPGATGGTLLALLTLAEGGDEFVVESPVYEPLLRQVERLGKLVHRIERRLQDAWRLPLDQARDAISERTSVVLVTEPHNPSGVLAPRKQVLELAAMAASKGATLLVNEVYRGFAGTTSYHGSADNVVVVSSFSKLLGAYWARVGWLSSEQRLAQELRRAHWNMSIPSSAGAQAGLGFLEHADERTQAAVEAAGTGVDVVDAWVDAHDGLAWHRPNGPGFGVIGLPEGVDDIAFAERLHDVDGVLVVPGTWFQAPGTLRVSWIQTGDRLLEGLSILEDALRREQEDS